MHANQTHPHYSPSWVGGLMDPVFLRHAVNDAEGECHAEDMASPPAWPGWQAAVRRVAALWRRPSSNR
jgi:hypothetical protein